MSIKIKRQDDVTTLISIQDEMTIYNVSKQSKKLLPCLKPDFKLQIDLSGVTEIDSAGLQLLVFLKKESGKINNELNLINHSMAVVEVFELLNLASFFGDPVVMPAEWDEI